MDSLLSLEASGFKGSLSYSRTSVKFSEDSLVIEKALLRADAAKVNIGVGDLNKSLFIKGQKIIEKLNELLVGPLPGGIVSLKPQDVTPEATADRIVKGATAFFDSYAKSNPNLDSEELLNRFMELVRKGVDSGYEDAYNTLQGLGAFDFEGVEDGIKETKALIESKLVSFENHMRAQLGIDPSPEEQIATPVKQDLLAQGGVNLMV